MLNVSYVIAGPRAPACPISAAPLTVATRAAVTAAGIAFALAVRPVASVVPIESNSLANNLAGGSGRLLRRCPRGRALGHDQSLVPRPSTVF